MKQDTYMENPSSGPASIQDYWAIVDRRKWWLIVPLVLSLPVGYWIAKNEPKIYSASTVILIESPVAPQEYILEPESSIEVRLSKIRREILRKNNITKIIEEFNLFEDQIINSGVTDPMINAVRQAIWIETLKTNITTGRGGGKSLDAFVLSFEGENPETVLAVDNRLAMLFIEENRSRRERFVESTSTFLSAEVDNLRGKLEKQEKKISDFKREYMGELPEQLGANLRSKEKYQQDLGASLDELKQLYERKAFLETELANVASGQSLPDSLEKRLAELKDRLLRLQGVFRDNYPDVIATKQEIQLLESLMAQPANGETAESIPPSETPAMQAAYAKLQNELYSTEIDIKALDEREAELTRLIHLYQERVDKAPVREQQLLALMRDYDNTKDRYKSLLDRKLKVEISENIQRQTEEDQFRIFEPATLPKKPIRPDVFQLILTAILYGGAVGVGLALLMEYTDSSFHKVDDVEKATGFRVLCAIPRFSRTQVRPVVNGLRKQIHGPVSVFLNDPQSVAAEQYRFLCGRIQQWFKGSIPKAFGITSSVVGEGKSTTALNLAFAFSTDFRKKTILIDADLHKPGSEWAQENGKKGLVEVLKGEVPLESTFVGVRSHNLTILPKGNIYKANTIELLGNNSFSEIIKQLKGYFDYVIVDCPPLLQVASTGLILESLDGFVFVVKADETPKALPLKAREIMEEEMMLGVVFNSVKDSEMPKKYYYSHSYSNV